MSKGRGRYSQNYRKIRRHLLANATHCAICGQPFDPDAKPHTSGYPTLDHIVPLSVNSDLAETVANLRPAHMACNSGRGVDRLTKHATTREW